MIGIQYGPISAGLQAARGAGIAQRNRTVAQDDLSFLGLMNQAQAHQDQQYANQVQQALGVKEFNSDQAMQQQHMAAQQAMANRDFQFRVYDQNRDAGIRQQAIQQQGQLGQARVGIQGDRLDLAQQKYGNQQNAIAQLPADVQPVVGATGRMPWVPNRGQQDNTPALTAIGRRLDAEIAQEQKNAGSFTVGKNDLTSEKSKDPSMPGVIAGMENKFKASQQRLLQLQADRQHIDDALRSRTQSILQPGATVDPAQATRDIARQNTDKSGGNGQGADDNGGIQTASDGTPVVKTAQDYAQLPSGTVYINGNTGQKARKP